MDVDFSPVVRAMEQCPKKVIQRYAKAVLKKTDLAEKPPRRKFSFKAVNDAKDLYKLAGYALFCPALIPELGFTSVFNGYFMSAIYYTHPWVYSLCWCAMEFLLGGAAAVLCFAVGSIDQICSLIRRERDRGALVIMSCHDAAILEWMSDEMFTIYEGKVERNVSL